MKNAHWYFGFLGSVLALIACIVFLFASVYTETITAIYLGAILGIIITLILGISLWGPWTINPANMEIWYTKDSLTGAIEFYPQGLSFKKSPFAKRVVDDSHKGKIDLARVLTEEDAPGELYTATDNAVVGFDWQVEWYPDVVSQDGRVDQDACLTFLKTTEENKRIGVRARIERYLTYACTQHASEYFRTNIDEVTKFVGEIFGGVTVRSHEEEVYAIGVNNPELKGVLDSPDVQKARMAVKASALAQEVQANMKGVDDNTLVMMGKASKEIIKIDAPPGLKVANLLRAQK